MRRELLQTERWRAVLALLCALPAAWLVAASGLSGHWLMSVEQTVSGFHEPVAAQIAASPFGAVSAAMLIAIALATLWREGARGWFAPLRHGR